MLTGGASSLGLVKRVADEPVVSGSAVEVAHGNTNKQTKLSFQPAKRRRQQFSYELISHFTIVCEKAWSKKKTKYDTTVEKELCRLPVKEINGCRGFVRAFSHNEENMSRRGRLGGWRSSDEEVPEANIY